MGFREDLGVRTTGTVRAYSPNRGRVSRSTREPTKKEGHDALIESLRHKNTYIRIVTTGGDVVIGRLNQSDRFTISLTIEDEQVPTIFFKHAIESFTLDVRE